MIGLTLSYYYFISTIDTDFIKLIASDWAISHTMVTSLYLYGHELEMIPSIAVYSKIANILLISYPPIKSNLT